MMMIRMAMIKTKRDESVDCSKSADHAPDTKVITELAEEPLAVEVHFKST